MRVFVTTELFPFTAGGIGRVISNLLLTSSPEERSRTVVVMVESNVSETQFRSVYPDVGFVGCTEADYELRGRAGEQFAPKWAFTNTVWHWRSVLTLQALLKAESEYGALEYIEFPDWGGLAFAPSQHKLLGLGFADTTLAIRLHSTDGIITEHEARNPAEYNLSLFDIERKALADVDLVIGQLAPVAEAVRTFYDFDEAAWRSRLVIHSPPVLLEGHAAPEGVAFDADTPLIFTSKLQHIKRPDVFVRGCVGFMRANPEYRGKATFLAHAGNDDYARCVRGMIPSEFASRFEFIEGLPPVGRERIIATGLCIFANAWESFCLAAYEAGLLGALCLLNETTVAFGDETPWVDGRNCLKFDGTPNGLANVLEAAFRSGFRAPERVQVPQQDSAPENVPCHVAPVEGGSALPRVSVIVPHFNLGQYVLSTLDSVLGSDYPNIEIVIVDDASTDEWSRHVMDRVQSHADVNMKVVRRTTNAGLAATRNLALAHCTGDYVLPLDADDLIHPQFIRTAVKALARQPKFDFVVPQVAFFLDGEQGALDSSASFSDYAIFHGEARFAGLCENRYSTATMLIRASVLREFQYREELDSYEDWDLYQRMVARGARGIVTSAIQFFYRRRAESMIHSEDARARRSVYRHDLMRGKRMGDFFNLPAFVVANAFTVRELYKPVDSMSPADVQELADFRNSETVFAALTIARAMQRRAPWLLAGIKQGMKVGWRAVKVLRGAA
jgi:glycosyltransferase involved in cell wall biosynthesis